MKEHGDGTDIRSLSEEERLEIFPTPDEDEIVRLMEVARNSAKHHFNTSTVEMVELGTSEGIIFDVSGWPTMFFFAIDDTGRVVDMTIARETNQLESLNTPMEFWLP